MTLHRVAGLDGGIDLTIHLTEVEADAIGPDEASAMAAWFDTALEGLAALRDGQSVRDGGARAIEATDMQEVIKVLHQHLLPRLVGLRDAAIRRHGELGGTFGQLAAAMGTARSTAQTHRERLDQVGPRRAQAAKWEAWAASPQTSASAPEGADG
ncbi:hypothetical protein SUDANB105_08081 (plasmid) [Streptomyces sp. enrichment culture]|uniref:hypothetical protein n=1 Tax=Streptomyces sp. enrichment culture TaxID=1795815 RepID=UPI003F544DC3